MERLRLRALIGWAEASARDKGLDVLVRERVALVERRLSEESEDGTSDRSER
jgi:hypothetical protein